MFQKSIISEELSLYNFFEKLKLDLYLTKPQISRLENIMNATLSKGYNGKISDVAQVHLNVIEQVLLDFYQSIILKH